LAANLIDWQVTVPYRRDTRDIVTSHHSNAVTTTQIHTNNMQE